MSAGKDYPKVRADDITIDREKWVWHVPHGGGYYIAMRANLPDGRIKFTVSDGHEMIVRPDDRIRARRHWNGWWDGDEFGYRDLDDKWVVISRHQPRAEEK